MARRALIRGSIVLVAGITTLSAVGCPVAAAAQAALPSETVIPAASGFLPLTDSVAFAGPGGFLHKPQGASGYVWTKYTGGPDVPVAGTNPSGAGADIVATAHGTTVQLQDMDTGSTTTITVPGGQSAFGTYGSHVLSRTFAAGATPLHVLTVANGQQTDTPVTGWPSGTVPGAVLAGDATSAVVRYDQSNGSGLGLLDLASGRLTPVFESLNASIPNVSAVLTDTYIGWYDSSLSHPVLHLVRRADPTAPETTLQVPWPSLPNLKSAGIRQLAIVGDTLLIDYLLSFSTPQTQQDQTGPPLFAMPLAGGTPTAVMDHLSLYSGLAANASGVLVIGGSSVTDWGARQLTQAADGTLADILVHAEPAPPPPVVGLSLSGGQLLTVEQGSSRDVNAYTRSIQLGSQPSYGPHTVFGLLNTGDCTTAATCMPAIGTGDGRVSLLSTNAAGDWITDVTPSGVDGMVNPGGTDGAGPAGPTGGTLVDTDGRYSVYDNPSAGKQYVTDTTATTRYGSSIFSGGVLFTRSITGAALSGETLWTADPTAGSLSATDLPTRQTVRTVNSGASCVPSELQVSAGRWLFWSCGASGPAGVYDLAANKEIPVPSSGPTQLGDGYLVEHDLGAGKLMLTDVHTDTAVTSDLAGLPAGPLADDRHVTWAVDTYGGGIAYVDAQQDIHVLDPHIPASPASGYRMLPGQRLIPGHSLTSGSMRLVMQEDGNLVAYLVAGGSSAPAEWASNTSGHPGAYAVMQTDGNLVVYGPNGGPGSGGALWASNTSGDPGAHAALQEDGNLVVYRQGSVQSTAALWASGSSAAPQTLTPGETLKPGWWTQGQHTFLVMQPDGNLVLYRRRDGAAIWASNTSGHPGAYAVMQTDGNLVVYRKGGGPSTGGALWASGTSGHPRAWAWMQDDGNVVVYPSTATTIDPTGALWASNTWKSAQ